MDAFSYHDMRDRWMDFLYRENSGFLVCPLVDDWFPDEAFTWPYDHAIPLPMGGTTRAVVEQIALAGLCGYDPLFQIAPDWHLERKLPIERSTLEEQGNRTLLTRIETPYGMLSSRSVENVRTGSTYMEEGLIKTKNDYPAYDWYLRQRSKVDPKESIQATRRITDIVHRYGPVGIGILAPGIYDRNKDVPPSYAQAAGGCISANHPDKPGCSRRPARQSQCTRP